MVSCLAVVTAAVTLLNIPQHNPDMKVTSKTCHFYNQFNIKWKQWFLFLLKVTEQNFQLLLFLEPPLDKNGTTTAPAIEKSLTAQCICLGSEWQRNRRMDRTEVCIYMWFYLWYMWSDLCTGIYRNGSLVVDGLICCIHQRIHKTFLAVTLNERFWCFLGFI